jgi:sec-independent protein translocase protein TatA
MPEFLSPEKILLVVVIAMLLMGPKRLPAVGRWVGRTLKEFRTGAAGLGDEVKAGLASSDASSDAAVAAAVAPAVASRD